jgi:hypothetical protein
MMKSSPTQRAVDSRVSPRFSVSFLALAEFRSRTLSAPAMPPLTQAVMKASKKVANDLAAQ